jgi:hypothetical protein
MSSAYEKLIALFRGEERVLSLIDHEPEGHGSPWQLMARRVSGSLARSPTEIGELLPKTRR